MRSRPTRRLPSRWLSIGGRFHCARRCVTTASSCSRTHGSMLPISSASVCSPPRPPRLTDPRRENDRVHRCHGREAEGRGRSRVRAASRAARARARRHVGARRGRRLRPLIVLELTLLAIASAFWPLLLAVVLVSFQAPRPVRILACFLAGGLLTCVVV